MALGLTPDNEEQVGQHEGKVGFRQRNQRAPKYRGGRSLRHQGRLAWLDTGIEGDRERARSQTTGEATERVFAGTA